MMLNKSLGFQYWQMNDLTLEEELLSSKSFMLCKQFCFSSGGTWHKDPPLLSAAWECTAGMAMDFLFVKLVWLSPQAFYQCGSICESNCSPAVHPLPAGSCSIKSLLILLVTLNPWWVCTKSFLLYYSLMHEIPQKKPLKILFLKKMSFWNYCQSFWGNSPHFHLSPFYS